MESKAVGHKPETSGIIVAGKSCWTSTVHVRQWQEVFSLDRPVGSTEGSSCSGAGCDSEEPYYRVTIFSRSRHLKCLKICDFNFGNTKPEASYP